MNPPVAPPGQLPGYNFYRKPDNSYSCPVCEQLFGAAESLQNHINESHTFRENPNGARFASPATPANNAGSPNTTAKVTSTPAKVTQVARYLQIQPRSTIRGDTQPVPSSRRTQPPPSNGQMLPPNTTPITIPEEPESIQNQAPSWIETTRWPRKTETFLKELVHTHSLYVDSPSEKEYFKLLNIFDSFYRQTDFRGWRPPRHDKRLWELFRAKIAQIQSDMLLQGETVKMSDGTIKRTGVPGSKALTMNNNDKPESLATPPATPILGSDKLGDGIELWNKLDIDGQAALFRQQLRSAKNRKGLMLEWNEYCAEIREKKGLSRSRDPKSSTPSVRSSGSKTPTPADPSLLGKIDVKSIMAKKTQELEAKRSREKMQAAKERASEERRAKRAREDPA